MIRSKSAHGKRRSQVAAAAFVAVISADVLSGASKAPADEIERGKELAEKLCAICHLNPGQGEKSGPDTVPGFAAVARRPGQTLEGIMDWLRSVPPMMPDHHLSQDEMEAIGFYILSLRDAPKTQPTK